MSVNYLIQLRRDTAANWSSKNPILASGEIALETDTRIVKIGDGTTAWNSLANISNTFLTTGGTFVGDVFGPTITQSHNYVLNSAFDIWQRGTSFTYGSQRYSADRWKVGRVSNTTGGTTNRSTTVPDGFDYSTFLLRDSGNDKDSSFILSQPFESAGKNLRGKTVTLSFYALRGSGYSATGNLLQFGFDSSSIAPESVGYATGGLFLSSNPDRVTSSQEIVLTTSWQRFSGTFTIPTTANAFLIYFRYNPNGTAAANDFVRITGVQLEEGPVATTYKKNSGNVQSELVACQRFYNSSARIDMGYMNDHNGFGIGTYFGFPTTMRVTPTVSFGFTNFDNATNGGSQIILPAGFVYRSFRANASFGYFRYGITYVAEAEL